jgi:2-amino-4-hydroxy-6-hydroxymethyldihydropteridine diphosphokinase
VRSVRWGPRTLDVDVLWIDGVALDDPELTVPHPRWLERRFVLAPLAELAPDLVDATALEDAGGQVAPVGTL